MSATISILKGTLGKDAERISTNSGTSILKFNVAVNSGYGDNKKTTWYNCAIFGKQAEGRLSEFLFKGQSVSLSGDHVLNDYDKKDGTKGYSNDINVYGNSLQLIGQKQESSNSQAAPVAQSNPNPMQANELDDFDESIPF